MGGTAGGENDKEAQAQILIKMVMEQATLLFHDTLSQGYVVIPVAGHIEVLKIESSRFRHWAARQFYEASGKAIGSEAYRSARDVISGEATLIGPEHAVHNRTAWHEDKINYDLSDPAWRVVEIDPSGWRIIDKAPVFFRRYEHQRPQVVPEPVNS